jgi:putative ATPase
VKPHRDTPDLFDAAAEDRIASSGPLADRLRPHRLDEVLGQDHLLGKGRPLQRMVAAHSPRSVVLWGPPGVGKTTIAALVARESGAQLEMASAVSATVKDIREIAAAARKRLGAQGTRTVLFLDEIHRFTRSQQDALLPSVETGLLTLIGATTESPWATINRPLLSRCTVLELKSLDDHACAVLADRGCALLGCEMTPTARTQLIACVEGDGRRLLTTLESAAALCGDGAIDESVLQEALGAGLKYFDRTVHYDAASALIKHLRASNEEQALAWLAMMLDRGEDPRFVARRLVIFASEDIGLADRSALLVAVAAADTVEFVGMPEARYALAHAALVCARAAKSREVVEALERADLTPLLPPPGT